MSLDTFSGLKAAIARRMKRSDLTSDIPDFITLAEDWIGKNLRTWRMESLETLTASASDPLVGIPARTRVIKSIHLTGTYAREIFYLPQPAFQKLYSVSTSVTPTVPRHFTMQEGNLVLGPTPSEAFTLSALCVFGAVPLDVTNPSNILLTNYPSLYLESSLVEGFRHLRNTERMGEAIQARDEALILANKESRAFKAAGTPDGTRSPGRRNVV